MPAQYEAIRNKFRKEGMPMDEAQMRAAKIYNSQHPDSPMGAHKKKKHPYQKAADMMK